jgi:hypothetical protein
MIYITLNQITAFGPCTSGWRTLLKSLNKTDADNEPVSLLHILQSNGLADAIWCMRVNWFEHKPLYMQFVNNCATRAQGYVAAAYAADAAAADAADAAAYAAAYAAADAAYAAADAAYAAAYAAVKKLQTEDLTRLLLEHNAP